MTTINAVNVGLSGATGTGNFVGANTPTLITPVLGAATATSVTFSPTTGGIVGTTTNDNAGSGTVGEFVSSVIASTSAVSVPMSDSNINITSISLTAGDWDVWGNCNWITSVAGSTVFGWISSSSATVPDASLITTFQTTAILSNASPVPSLRFSLSGTTTIYLSGTIGFISGTASIAGGIYARRSR